MNLTNPLNLIPCSEQLKTPSTWNKPWQCLYWLNDDSSHHLLLIQFPMEGWSEKQCQISGQAWKHRFLEIQEVQHGNTSLQSIDQTKFQLSYDQLSHPEIKSTKLMLKGNYHSHRLFFSFNNEVHWAQYIKELGLIMGTWSLLNSES